MRLRGLISILLFLLSTTLSNGENSKIDSLTRLLRTKLSDSQKVNLFNQLAYEHHYSDYEIALEYANNALALAKLTKSDQQIAEAYERYGYIFSGQNNYPKAIEYYLNALKTYKVTNNRHGMARCYNSIGLIYLYEKNPAKANEYLLKSLHLHKETNNALGMAYAFSNIGDIYMNRGALDRALKIYNRSLEMKRELNDQRGIANSLNDIGYIFYLQEEYEQALSYLLSSAEIKDNVNNVVEIPKTYNNIGRVYLALKNYPLALKYLNQSLSTAQRTNSKNFEMEAFLILSSLYESQNNFNLSLDNYKHYSYLKDSLNTVQQTIALDNIESNYENEMIDLEDEIHTREQVTEIQHRDELQLKLIAVFFMALFIAVIFIGEFSFSLKMSSNIIFVSFLLLFEFFILLSEKYIEGFTNAPVSMLLLNVIMAIIFIPLHQYLTAKINKRIIKKKRDHETN